LFADVFGITLPESISQQKKQIREQKNAREKYFRGLTIL